MIICWLLVESCSQNLVTDGAAIHVVCSDQDEMIVLCSYLSSFRILYRTALIAKIIALLG